MLRMMTRRALAPTDKLQKSRAIALGLGCWALSLGWGCEAPPKPAPSAQPEPKADQPAPAAKVASPPSLSVDAGGPIVRGMSVMLEQTNGAPNALGLTKLKEYLQEEKSFLEGKELHVSVARSAKPSHVAIFLSELGNWKPSKVVVSTDTRPTFSKEVAFVPDTQLKAPDRCSLIGTITQDRGTAIWRLSGGPARKRPRGMGGPDLSTTADTILSMTKGCDSDTFFVTAPPDVEWGLVFDLAASAIALEGSGLVRAVIPQKSQTAGNPAQL